MSLHTPNEFTLTPTKCHICYGEIREDQHAIEHSGHGQLVHAKQMYEGYTTTWFHPECATVLVLRLANDVMRIKTVKDQPKRVVDELQDLAKVNQVR